MNKLVIFVFLPFMVTFVLCMNYGMQGNYGNWGGPSYYGGGGGGGGGYNYGYSGYDGYGYNYGGGKGYGGKGLALQNVVYYPQLTPYYTPYGGQGEIDPLLGLLGFLLLLYAFNISGINNG